MKKRLLFYEIKKYLDHKNTLVITGMRQVGKTTILRHLFDEIKSPTKLFFDLDNPLDQKIFEDIDYKNIYHVLSRQAKFKSNQRLYVFIDEIQNFPEITKIIKYLMDHFKVKFIVTGSSSFYLKNLFPESLSGRKFLYQLHPMSFKEFLYFNDQLELKEISNFSITKALRAIDIFTFKKYEKFYEEYMLYGGFPEVVLTEDDTTKKQVLKNIFASFFEKDLKILSDYKDIKELRDLILLLVPRVGSQIDITKLASELGVDRPKVYGYLEFLSAVFVIKLLPKFSRSIDKSIAGGRKIYFSDNGILNTIGKVNDGQLFENTIINQLSQYGKVSFFNKRVAEIDAILDNEISFEAKLHGSDSDLRKLASLSKDIKIKNFFVISRSFVDKKGFACGTQL